MLRAAAAAAALTDADDRLLIPTGSVLVALRVSSSQSVAHTAAGNYYVRPGYAQQDSTLGKKRRVLSCKHDSINAGSQ